MDAKKTTNTTNTKKAVKKVNVTVYKKPFHSELAKLLTEKIESFKADQLPSIVSEKVNFLKGINIPVTKETVKAIEQKAIDIALLKQFLDDSRKELFFNKSNSLNLKKELLKKELLDIDKQILELKGKIHGKKTVKTLAKKTDFKSVEKSSYYTSEEYDIVKNHLVEKLTQNDYNNQARFLCNISDLWNNSEFKSDNFKYDKTDSTKLHLASLKCNIQSSSILHDIACKLLNIESNKLLKIGKNNFIFNSNNQVFLA